MHVVGHKKLRGRFVEYGYNLKTAANELGISRYSLTNKMNWNTEFSISEVFNICKLVNIGADEIEIFFAQSV
jgi:DNA-binding XRE family transcriptional regulator